MHKLYIIGAGPGDPELLTVKAKRLLTSYAEIVVHDKLISEEMLALIPKHVEKIFAGKEPKLHHMKQDDINNVLVEKARTGKKVVRLKGGDPFIFGRGGEEAEHLKKNGIEFEIVPGITSAIGAAAEINLPLTYRNLAEGVIFLTGHNSEDKEPELDYTFLAKTNNTIVIYMGVQNIEIIAKQLINAGKNSDTPACAIYNGTNGTSKTAYSTLSKLSDDMKKKAVTNPAIIYIGDVVKISQDLS